MQFHHLLLFLFITRSVWGKELCGSSASVHFWGSPEHTWRHAVHCGILWCLMCSQMVRGHERAALWLFLIINEFVWSSKWQIKDFKIVCLQMKFKRRRFSVFVFTFLFVMFSCMDGLRNRVVRMHHKTQRGGKPLMDFDLWRCRCF